MWYGCWGFKNDVADMASGGPNARKALGSPANLVESMLKFGSSPGHSRALRWLARPLKCRASGAPGAHLNERFHKGPRKGCLHRPSRSSTEDYGFKTCNEYTTDLELPKTTKTWQTVPMSHDMTTCKTQRLKQRALQQPSLQKKDELQPIAYRQTDRQLLLNSQLAGIKRIRI